MNDLLYVGTGKPGARRFWRFFIMAQLLNVVVVACITFGGAIGVLGAWRLFS